MKLMLIAAAASVWSGVYAPEQAKRGEALYLQHCAAACHIENHNGNGPAPALRGPEFLLKWEDFTLADLLKQIRATMPKVAPGSLSDAQYTDVIAYLLAANKFPPGKELRGDSLNAVIAPK
jgi:mono/diheme cytochrome c family protein